MTDSVAESPRKSFYEKFVETSLYNPKQVYQALFYALVVFFLVTTLYPIYFVLIVALTPLSKIHNMAFLPKGFNPDVFIELFRQAPYHLFVFNSLVIALSATVVVILIGSVAGYVFGRLEFRGRRPLLLGLLVISYFPPASFLVPLFRLFTGNVSLLGVSSPNVMTTPIPVIAPLSALSLPFGIYILTTFFSQIPDGLEDAARVEGDTRLGALFRVIMPLASPGVAAAGVITFIFVYNEFFFSFIMTSGSPTNWSPIVWGILHYKGLHSTPFNLMAAASLIGIVPMAIIVVVAQRKIVSGLTAGALKE